MIAVLGCGGSGTNYIAVVMKRLGLEFGHEELGKDGLADWRLTPYDFMTDFRSWMRINNIVDSVFPYRSRIDFNGSDIVFHQVRHPLKAISSICMWINDSGPQGGVRGLLGRFTSVEKGDSRLLAAMKYWLEWNKVAEYKAVYRYRVECLKDVWEEFLSKARLNGGMSFPQDIPKTIASRNPNRHFDWNDLIAEDREIANKIIMMSDRYGYEV
jgi:hypothetical protein